MGRQTIRGRASGLNPYAEPWDPEKERGTEEDRTIFITFSRGYALTLFEIFCFFTSEYGLYSVENIYIHQPDLAIPPLFGRVLFSQRSIVWMVLRNEEKRQYAVGGKTLWCKTFKRNEVRMLSEEP